MFSKNMDLNPNLWNDYFTDYRILWGWETASLQIHVPFKNPYSRTGPNDTEFPKILRPKLEKESHFWALLLHLKRTCIWFPEEAQHSMKS
jgi:hypothetical protein